MSISQRVCRAPLSRLVMLCILSLNLAACSNSEKAPALVGTTEKAEPAVMEGDVIDLSNAEIELYQNNLKTLITPPPVAGQPVTFLAVKAMKFETEPGHHICGYMKYQDSSGSWQEPPFYVELRNDEAGAPTLHRGQLGSDDGKIAKVKFVCRSHDIF